MKRTKQWWAALTRQERIELYWLERAGSSRSSYIPDDCSECGNCGTPHFGSGLCPLCLDRLLTIREKANKRLNDTTTPETWAEDIIKENVELLDDQKPCR